MRGSHPTAHAYLWHELAAEISEAHVPCAYDAYLWRVQGVSTLNRGYSLFASIASCT